VIIKGALDGELDKRANADIFLGGWNKLVTGVNEAIKNIVDPLMVTADYVDRISKGAIPPTITTAYKGQYNIIKNNLNECIRAVGDLVSDAGMLAQAAVEGRLQTRADATKHQGDFRKIVEGVNKTLDLVIDPINETIAILKRMAEGDLTPTMTGDYKGDFDVLKTALNDTLAAINDLLGQVTMAVDQVTSGSQQVSQASQSLSQGATEQASSLEEITSSITEIAGQTKQNTENAVQMNGLAKTARDDAEQGNLQMKDLVSAMTDINSSAEEIRKIVKAIDDISFQINLLALNANVEAARAGKYGKGFAVVAEEVRNLAVRSAGSVQETTKMVDEAISNIGKGNGLVAVTAKQLQSIVGGAAQVATIAEEVATAGKEQAQGLDQISTGLNQIDQVTQANTASAEESASAAEELSSQSQQLKAMLAKFKLAAREQRLTNDDVMRMLQTEMGRQGLANRSGITLRRDAAPAPQAHPALAASTAGKPGRKPVNPAEVIALDDDDFGKF
jgi:methyl-accepting chemotaxis protein